MSHPMSKYSYRTIKKILKNELLYLKTAYAERSVANQIKLFAYKVVTRISQQKGAKWKLCFKNIDNLNCFG